MQKDYTHELAEFLKSQRKTFNDPFLGGIVVERQLGQGGNGLVFCAKLLIDPDEKQPLAIKFLTNIETSKNDRFIAEYINPQLAELTYAILPLHAGKLKINDSIEIPYIIMKRYQSNLQSYLESLPEITKNKAKEILGFLLKATKEIHEKSIVHRDLKPQNILIDERGKMFLADFGIASFADELYAKFHKTEEKERLGNREYAAPEQGSGCNPHPSMDIYAIGQIMHKVCNGKIYRDSESYHTEQLQEYDEIFSQCLRQEANERPQTISDLQELLIRSDKSKQYMLQCSKYIRDVMAFRQFCNRCSPEYGDISNITNAKRIHFLFSSVIQQSQLIDGIREVSEDVNFQDYKISDINCTDDLLLRLGYRVFKISDIWVIKDSACYCQDNDFILIHHIPFEQQEGSNIFYYYNGHEISEQEYNSRCKANNDGTTEELDEKYLDYAEHVSKNGYIAIGATQNRFQHPENEIFLRKTLKKMGKSSTPPSEELIKEITRVLRQHKIQEVHLYE